MLRNVSLGVPILFNASTICPHTPCEGHCPDFTIKRHDTYPPFRVQIEDCNGPLHLHDYQDDLVLEANMWSSARLKHHLTDDSNAEDFTYFGLADDRGFDRMLPNDIIIMDRIRLPEQMLVTGFDEERKLVQVVRGYHGTPISFWKKGTHMKIFRVLNATAPQTAIEFVRGEGIGQDGSMKYDILKGTYLVYNLAPNDTCLPGCYMLEFKLLKMTGTSGWSGWSGWSGYPSEYPPVNLSYPPDYSPYTAAYWDNNWTPSWTPSWTPPSFTPSTTDYDCDIGSGVEWVRRFPVSHPGFVIHIVDDQTSENL